MWKIFQLDGVEGVVEAAKILQEKNKSCVRLEREENELFSVNVLLGQEYVMST